MSFAPRHKGRIVGNMSVSHASKVAYGSEIATPGVGFRTDRMKPEDIRAESGEVKITTLPKDEIDRVFEKAKRKYRKK